VLEIAGRHRHPDGIAIASAHPSTRHGTWKSPSHPETVTYRTEVVCHDGAFYQPAKDTAQTPGGSDWVCVARAGRDGLSLSSRGTFDDMMHTANWMFSLVTPTRSWLGVIILARAPAPTGNCLRRLARVSRNTRREGQAPRSRRDSVGWLIDRERCRASPRMSDGTVGPMLELRDFRETSYCATNVKKSSA
jgi:hypothetical protein